MSDNQNRDRLFADPIAKINAFSFDERVAKVFPDMIKRSVPGYLSVISTSGVIANYFARDNTHCYDLGCSLGATTLSMRHHIKKTGCRIIAVDNSEAMIDRCRQNIAMDSADIPVDLICADINDVRILNASVVALNFTLQFVAPELRDHLVANIFRGINQGGVLMLAEKVHFADPARQSLLNELHIEFKRSQDYSELEIAQKRTALENVLVTETIESHEDRLRRIGFRQVHLWYQCLNFVALVAIK